MHLNPEAEAIWHLFGRRQPEIPTVTKSWDFAYNLIVMLQMKLMLCLTVGYAASLSVHLIDQQIGTNLAGIN